MNFAPIVPIQYKPADITTYHLILAHQVCLDEEYRNYYTSLPSNHSIILDNSVIELGKVDLSYVHGAVKHFSESEFDGKLILVAPDSLRDRKATVTLHKEFLEQQEMVDAIKHPETHLMVVPQGKDVLDWKNCLMDIYSFADKMVTYVGIPRLTEDFKGGRFNLVMESYDLLHDQNVHLLGIQHQLNEVKWAKEFPNILGVDSSLPLRAAYSNITAAAVEDLRTLPDPDSYMSEIYNRVRLRIKECQSYVKAKPYVLD